MSIIKSNKSSVKDISVYNIGELWAVYFNSETDQHVVVKKVEMLSTSNRAAFEILTDDTNSGIAIRA